MKVHFGSPNQVQTVSCAVPLYGIKEFESPTRSTIPMLSLLIHNPGMFAQIVDELEMPRVHDLFLEYTVPPPKGRGKASHTDVMLKAGPHALGIEAKWTEPMYPTVEAWIKEGTNEDNRRLVLDGWLSLLQKRVTKKLMTNDSDDAIYQMVHRAASAAASGDHARLAYSLFELPSFRQEAGHGDIVVRLRDLWSKLGNPQSFPFYAVTIKIEPLEAYESIRHLPKGRETTADSVIAALQSDSPLFEFQQYQVQKIEENS